jgi:DNA polymerase-3 subunit epsilon
LESLTEKLPTFVLVDDGITTEEKLCLLIERGSFWGMGYLPRSFVIGSTGELKNFLNPYADNDYIRNSIYSFAEANPDKRIALSR